MICCPVNRTLFFRRSRSFIGSVFCCTTRANPIVNSAQFELPKPTHFIGRHIPFCNPLQDSFSPNSKVPLTSFRVTHIITYQAGLSNAICPESAKRMCLMAAFRQIALFSLEKASAKHRTALLPINAGVAAPVCQRLSKGNSLDAHGTFGLWKYVLHGKAGGHNEPPAGVRPKMEINWHLGRSTAIAPWRTTKLYCCRGDRAKTWHNKDTSNRA